MSVDIPEWKLKVLLRKNKRDRVKNIRNRSKKSLIKNIQKPKIQKPIKPVKQKIQEIKSDNIIIKKDKTKVKLLIDHFEEMIDKNKN